MTWRHQALFKAPDDQLFGRPQVPHDAPETAQRMIEAWVQRAALAPTLRQRTLPHVGLQRT